MDILRASGVRRGSESRGESRSSDAAEVKTRRKSSPRTRLTKGHGHVRFSLDAVCVMIIPLRSVCLSCVYSVAFYYIPLCFCFCLRVSLLGRPTTGR